MSCEDSLGRLVAVFGGYWRVLGLPCVSASFRQLLREALGISSESPLLAVGVGLSVEGLAGSGCRTLDPGASLRNPWEF